MRRTGPRLLGDQGPSGRACVRLAPSTAAIAHVRVLSHVRARASRCGPGSAPAAVRPASCVLRCSPPLTERACRGAGAVRARAAPQPASHLVPSEDVRVARPPMAPTQQSSEHEIWVRPQPALGQLKRHRNVFSNLTSENNAAPSVLSSDHRRLRDPRAHCCRDGPLAPAVGPDAQGGCARDAPPPVCKCTSAGRGCGRRNLATRGAASEEPAPGSVCGPQNRSLSVTTPVGVVFFKRVCDMCRLATNCTNQAF